MYTSSVKQDEILLDIVGLLQHSYHQWSFSKMSKVHDTVVFDNQE